MKLLCKYYAKIMSSKTCKRLESYFGPLTIPLVTRSVESNTFYCYLCGCNS